jgi:predicted negative regulator of RcsB-dependent stress response
MKRKLEELRLNLEEFVEQTDYSVFLLSSMPNESVYVAGFLDGLDEPTQHSLFLVYPGPFRSAELYLADLLSFTEVQLKKAAEARQERGEPPPPPLPPALKDLRIEPTARFEHWLRYLPSLLPNQNEYSVVVGLLPVECEDPTGYARFVQKTVLHSQRPEWMERLRIVVFDSRQAPVLLPLIQRQKIETVLTWELDLSPPALVDALSRECADPSIPIAQRIASLVQLGGIDLAYQRYPDARQKYAAAFEFYSKPSVPAMQALCMQGAGDSLAAEGHLPEAREMYERGLRVCIEGNVLPSALMILQALVRVCFTMLDHADAEKYADSGSRLADGTLNPALYAHLLERRGDAQLDQGKRQEAIASYEHARRVAAHHLLIETWESALNKLIQLYDEAGMSAELSDRRSEHAEMSAERAADPRRNQPAQAGAPA